MYELLISGQSNYADLPPQLWRKLNKKGFNPNNRVRALPFDLTPIVGGANLRDERRPPTATAPQSAEQGPGRAVIKSESEHNIARVANQSPDGGFKARALHITIALRHYLAACQPTGRTARTFVGYLIFLAAARREGNPL